MLKVSRWLGMQSCTALPGGVLLGCKRLDTDAGDSLVAFLPAVCWRTVASYIGWWTCAVWSLITAVCLAMAHAGAATFT